MVPLLGENVREVDGHRTFFSLSIAGDGHAHTHALLISARDYTQPSPHAGSFATAVRYTVLVAAAEDEIMNESVYVRVMMKLDTLVFGKPE